MSRESGNSRAHPRRASRHRQGAHLPIPSVVTRSSACIEPPTREASREAMIAEAAYFRSAHRGFEPGHEVDDWLAAEAEIDRALSRGDLPQLCG